MSADIYIAGENFNVTYNVTKIFYDHIPAERSERGGLHEIVGLTGKQAIPVLSEAFDRMERTRVRLWRNGDIGEPRFCAEYDSKNGWGSTVGAILFLAQLLAACARNPRHKITAWF